MSRRKQLLWIYLLALPVVLVMALLLGALITESATAHASECRTCHSQKAIAMSEGKFVKVQCEARDQSSAIHFKGSSPSNQHLIAQLDQEVCYSCHRDKYDDFKILASVKTFNEANGGKPVSLEGWSITSDLPNWNALIDEHPLILETDG